MAAQRDGKTLIRKKWKTAKKGLDKSRIFLYNI